MGKTWRKVDPEKVRELKREKRERDELRKRVSRKSSKRNNE